MSNISILLRNNFVQLSPGTSPADVTAVGTILSNLKYYGFTLAKPAFEALLTLSKEEVAKWWDSIEPTLRVITLEHKRIDRFVVYKNFPKEVLDKSDSEYWLSQNLMYWGLPNKYFVEVEKPREALKDKQTPKVLNLAADDTLDKIFQSLITAKVQWNTQQAADCVFLLKEGAIPEIARFGFKENMVKACLCLMELGKTPSLSSAMDVMRLGAGLSNGDITLKTNTKFRFARKQRRFLLALLESTKNLEEDLARDREKWKRLLFALKPGDYVASYPKVNVAFDKLYKDKVKSFEGRVAGLLENMDEAALPILCERPGVFARKLHQTIDSYGMDAVEHFSKVVGKLTNIQLLKLLKYFETINARKHLIVAPQGQWSKAQVLPNKKHIKPATLVRLSDMIKSTIRSRLIVPIALDPNVSRVKLPGHNELLAFGKGTVLPLPESTTFLRSASYWEHKSGHSTWFDNGWNFFTDEWNPIGTCCWNSPKFPTTSGTHGFRRRSGPPKEVLYPPMAVFSGDPTSSKDSKGRACQMIDLYLNTGNTEARYAVWNILCYSKVAFDDAEVYGALQVGDTPDTGKLFEPSRAWFTFRITGKQFTKYILYVDLLKREVVYLDANLPAKVSSAQENESILGAKMPAMLEYLDAQPSVYDLFSLAPQAKDGLPVLFSDKGIPINGDAYVFRQENPLNKVVPLDLNRFL